MSTYPHRTWCRACRLLVGLLLLTMSACGLSDYEALMQKAQERADRFREEQRYLDEPVSIPSEKDKDGHDVPIADVFFRPPKGIQPTPKDQPRNGIMWQYLPRARGSEFAHVELAFADDDKEFGRKVMASYPQGMQQVPTPERKAWPYDSWEFNGGKSCYSINLYKGGTKQIAVVYMFPKEKREALRKAIDLSLLSLTEKTSAARAAYNQKSPWILAK